MRGERMMGQRQCAGGFRWIQKIFSQERKEESGRNLVGRDTVFKVSMQPHNFGGGIFMAASKLYS
ncbi:hypothetical protein NC652_034354 [Populus alba x Populus x berolinensis]|nr:hypothetical protein NC652_034354 [Populus alba x Populus x berolinensis]